MASGSRSFSPTDRELRARDDLSNGHGSSQTSRLDAEVETLARCQAAALTAPDVAEVERACAALRSATIAQADAERAADALSADRVQFLETSLEFHDRHGTRRAP